MPQSVIVVDKKDNVATALRQLDPGSSIPVEMEVTSPQLLYHF